MAGYFWGSENFSFPNEEIFGRYKGKTVRITYCLDYSPPKIRDNNGNRLEGIVRGFILDRLILTER